MTDRAPLSLTARQVLVLNRNWTAITTATVRQAMVLLFRDKAQAICPETYAVYALESWVERSQERVEEGVGRFLRTPTLPVEAPEVILLCAYGGIPRVEISFSRRNLYRRDGYACQYCGRNRPASELSIDHVLPRSRGGRTTWENCVLACVRCNSKKADRTPREVGFRLLKAPKKPTWSPLIESLPQAQPESWSRFLRTKSA
jgi:5-methylcytosine-specific restriction endonuclease McrA